MRYHPRIGFTYMPSAQLRIQGTNGGYLARSNASGFRSDREFVDNRGTGAFRALFFGDSQAAGDGVANPLRFTDLVEKRLAGLEIYNYGLSGSGTDQQFLTYEENRSVEHDLVVIVLYAENVRRNARRVLRSQDANGEVLFRAKPYYDVVDDSLVLRNVPVPRQVWSAATLPQELVPHVHVYGEEYSFFREPSRHHSVLLKRLAPAGPLRRAAKAALTPFRRFQPLPEYDTPDNPDWRLLRKILETWIAGSRTPVLLVPLPHETALTRGSDPANCQARFRELARDTGCHVYDPLDDLLALEDAEPGALWSSAYGHLSAAGHEAMAGLLAPVLQALMAQRPATDSP